MRNVLPSIGQVKLALATLNPSNEMLAVLHLSTPVDSIVNLGISFSSGRWSWRGIELEQRADVVAAVLEMVKKGARAGDVFLDLDAPPETWVKIEQSGSRKVAFGSELLFGSPAFLGEESLQEAAFHDAIRYWRSGGKLPLILHSADRTILVDGDSECWLLRDPRNSASPNTRTESVTEEEVAHELRSSLQLPMLGYMHLASREEYESFEYHFKADNYEVIVPVKIRKGALSLGVDSTDLLDPLQWAQLEGWVWRGWDPWSNKKVAEHIRSGILAHISDK